MPRGRRRCSASDTWRCQARAGNSAVRAAMRGALVLSRSRGSTSELRVRSPTRAQADRALVRRTEKQDAPAPIGTLGTGAIPAARCGALTNGSGRSQCRRSAGALRATRTAKGVVGRHCRRRIPVGDCTRPAPASWSRMRTPPTSPKDSPVWVGSANGSDHADVSVECSADAVVRTPWGSVAVSAFTRTQSSGIAGADESVRGKALARAGLGQPSSTASSRAVDRLTLSTSAVAAQRRSDSPATADPERGRVVEMHQMQASGRSDAGDRIAGGAAASRTRSRTAGRRPKHQRRHCRRSLLDRPGKRKFEHRQW
jgi:hypothetical protein